MVYLTAQVKQLLQRIRRCWRLLLGVSLVAGFLAMNTVAWLHARAMSRFVRTGERTASPEKLSVLARAGVLLTGVTLLRPENRRTPKDFRLEFQMVRFPGAKGIQLEAWFIPASAESAKGVALLFHGYGASKESLLPVAVEFHAFGWSTLLVDFHGSGGSAGDTTSVGWHEAEDVAAAFTAAATLAPGKPRVLYGASMGAAACLRAIHTLGLKPDALVMECPFDRMLTTVRSRFRAMRVPSWPFAELLVFWGGRQGSFDAFAHNPVDYARAVTCPVLLMHGGRTRACRLMRSDASAPRCPRRSRSTSSPRSVTSPTSKPSPRSGAALSASSCRTATSEELPCAEALRSRAGENLLAARKLNAVHWPRRWRDGRVAEGAGLLNRYTVKSRIGGSNPPLSATPHSPADSTKRTIEATTLPSLRESRRHLSHQIAAWALLHS